MTASPPVFNPCARRGGLETPPPFRRVVSRRRTLCYCAYCTARSSCMKLSVRYS